MEFIRSQKGGQLLLNDGFIDREARTNADGSISWRCLEKICRGRIREQGDHTLLVTEHNHATDTARVNAEKCKSHMREIANEPR